MRPTNSFFDTNLLLYLFSSSAKKADTVESLITEGGTISVQVLNEFAAVARRNLNMTIAEIS
ncbi:MAG: VapC toxin family PIN domain ribonuclease, partial [Burkholderiaceae bacterium]